MRFFKLSNGLAVTASAVAMTFAMGAPAFAQSSGPVTEDESRQCATLPTQTERDDCIRAQARPEGTAEEAGDPATQAPGETAERQAETQSIVVTGSRIRRSAFNTPDPLTVIDPELEQRGGRNDVGEIIQSSPVAAGSFQLTPLLTAGGFVTNGGVGAQTVSLRGLGAERTLTLVNGRRAGPAGTRGAIAGFDLNVIPSAAIQSVEILKTGASSIYGSDAIAGVVNLLTRRSTDGLELRGFSSAPLQGGGENYSLSAVYGKDFGRGYIIGGVDYTHRNEFERADRDYLLCPEEFLTFRDGTRADIIDPRTGRPRCNASFANSLSINQQNFPGQPGIVFSSIVFENRVGEFLSPVPNSATLALPAGFFGLPGCLASATPAQLAICRLGTGLADPIASDIGDTSVQPRLDRYTAFLQGGFNVTDEIELIGEFLFNRRETESQGFRQLFFSQFAGSGPAGGGARPSVFCTAAVRATRPNCNPATAGDPLNNGFVGNYFITPVIGVASDNATKVDYYRGVVGLRAENLGGLVEGWNFDSYVQYSRSDGDYTNGRIFQDAIELVEYRSQLCQPGQVTRIRQVPCVNIDFTDPRVIAGQFTPEENAFLFGSETGNTIYTQVTGEMSVAGPIFNLTGAGDISAAIGIQLRRDEIDDQPGAITTSGNVFAQSVSGRTAGHSVSKEVFAELEVPLLADRPFFQELTLSLAGRIVNSYSERSDGVNDRDNGNFTYKIAGNWAVNEWLRFRGSYGTSFRSPALFEQFLADQTGFQGQLAIDPCINFGQNVANGSLPVRVGERCAALGLDPARGPGGTSSAVVSTGGGIGVLDPETSTALSLGVVFTPVTGPWGGSRFSLAVDYFDIEVKGQVTTLGAANIIFTCFNSDDYPNIPECTLFDRQLNPALGRFGEITNVRNPFLNINSQRNRGVDFTARFTQDLGRWGNLSILGQATYQIEDVFELFAGVLSDSEGEIGEPALVGDIRATYANNGWSLFYGLNYIGGVSNEEDLRFSRGGDICIPSALRGGDVCPVFEIKPQVYHSASITRQIGERFTFTVGLNNIFNNRPPRASALNSPFGSNTGQVPTFGTQYDLLGRRAFVSVRARL
jgi:iron complex outermembrane receptor protein